MERQGRPVVGAVVRFVADALARPQTRTNDQGSFRLEGCASSPGFVFAEAEGFRFQGWPSDPSSGTVELTLAGSDEPAGRPLVTLPPVLSEAEEAASWASSG